MMSLENLLTITDVAEVLRKSNKTVYKRWKPWVQEGRMKVCLIGGKPRFQMKEVEKLVKSFEIEF